MPPGRQSPCLTSRLDLNSLVPDCENLLISLTGVEMQSTLPTCSAAYTLFSQPQQFSSPSTTFSPTFILGLSSRRINPLASKLSRLPAYGTDMGRASRKFGLVIGVEGSRLGCTSGVSGSEDDS